MVEPDRSPIGDPARAGFVCADGFIQRPACNGNIGCMSCGHVNEAYLPHCLNEDIPARWLNDDGSPKFYKPPLTKADAILASLKGEGN